MREVNFIWAEDLDGWIGKENSLPWHVPEDMKHFRELTASHPIIMGRKTYESIGQPLPHRQNIVLTHQVIADERLTVVHDVETLDQLIDALPDNQVYVIGGARIFSLMMPLVNKLERTIINGHYNGDVKMPPINYDQWHLIKRDEVRDDKKVNCWFETWELNKEKN
ncbi:dihydrofolate reductase [Limosilactobacillus fastidiosus]|uniref:Dihydrofolate reductase n=1 Tax=Limosilactobacillus fastidiosus TaxID=2759855 RepID=A0A7W3YC96_9LACO|nr:dihydrofolate reductase [Limosilactobacillus fastidiosus]MBB1062746.1 dihydrofolate reductase [Limosilactobacillus fastidiosus]MBB1086519.1 dihydrofolate reductase [Limosilactobacillus fastidiosus]MCD7084841.1 dihydrofolate reductase [Limosilactobacillus fastidiosus]MCD7085129.1 dihydrofolate reductase [Limosilactobacillus fastidiosus]MCD7115107.1 dihydrofolate reductase [Limosilactobacillus fastidiosus]